MIRVATRTQTVGTARNNLARPLLAMIFHVILGIMMVLVLLAAVMVVAA